MRRASGEDARADILSRVRKAQPAPQPLPEIPTFASAEALLSQFQAGLERMGGVLASPAPEVDLDGQVRTLFPDARVICSATPEVVGTRPIGAVGDAAQLDDVDVGIVRAAFGIAETGSVFVSEQHLKINALAFLPQHLIVLLDPTALVGDLHEAYRRPEFARARYALFLTGPCATADIEGVLVRGAQGIRSLTVVMRAPPSP